MPAFYRFSIDDLIKIIERCGAVSILTLMNILMLSSDVVAEPYSSSAHGNSIDGVHRTTVPLDDRKTGACINCHDQHQDALIDGVNANFFLFSSNFNMEKIQPPYFKEDNVCFRCHVSSESAQRGDGIINKQFSSLSGGYDVDHSIDVLGAFNLGSSHNLRDVQIFAESKFPFFKEESNPCVACHNPHQAKNNRQSPGNPTQTIISRPTDHNNLWGDDLDERMSVYDTYQPPHMYNNPLKYEPNNSENHNGELMIDYVTFCLDCHSHPDVYSTPLGRNLKAINWGVNGDIHGGAPRYEGNYVTAPDAILLPPYDQTLGGTSPNYILSCLDCHEPHGTILSANSTLLRKEINGGKVDVCCGPPSESAWSANVLCSKCHSIGGHCGPPGNNCYQCHAHGTTARSGCAGGLLGTWNKKSF